jgi:hypothetical protein
MNRIIFILILFFFYWTNAVNYYPGKAIKNDGTVLAGFFQYPDYSKIKKVKYKTSLEGKKAKIKSE